MSETKTSALNVKGAIRKQDVWFRPDTTILRDRAADAGLS
jgi:hypothetical protein